MPNDRDPLVSCYFTVEFQGVIVGAVAWYHGGERPSRSVLVSLPVVLGGVVAISGLLETGAYGRDPAAGVVLGLGAAAAYAGYLLIIRGVGRGVPGPAGCGPRYAGRCSPQPAGSRCPSRTGL